VNAPFPITTEGQLVLRVLNGRLAGAEYRLHAGKFIRVGHSFGHDVVLRGAETNGFSAELHLLDDIATIRVVAGNLTLLGRPVAAGEEAHLPFYVPVSIGEFAIAVGEEGGERWVEADALFTSMGNLPKTVTADAHGTEIAQQPANLLQRFTTRMYPMRDWVDAKRNWPKYGIVAGILLLAVALGGPAYQWANNQFRGADYGVERLASAGFKNLTVKRDAATDRLVITGTLRTDKDLANLRSYAEENLPGAIVDVQTTESHAAAATEILGSQGIEGTVKPAGIGALLVTSEFLPQDRKANLIALFKQDLPAVKRVRFAENSAMGERDLQYFFSSGDFGLASYVNGDPSYIVTADGTRWFPGATVPTGHVITAMGDGRITFEREGRIDELVL
jgi:type III secretion protein D